MFEAMDRLEKEQAVCTSDAGVGEKEKEKEEEEDMVEVVASEFKEKDMQCPYSGNVMRTPMKSKVCSHRLDRESLKALVEYFSTRNKDLKDRRKPQLVSNCPIYGCKGLWKLSTSTIDKELRAKIQQVEKNGGILDSSSGAGAVAVSQQSQSSSSPPKSNKRKVNPVLDLCSDSETDEPAPASAAASVAVSVAVSAATTQDTAAAAAAAAATAAAEAAASSSSSSSSSSLPPPPPGVGLVPPAAANNVSAASPLRSYHLGELEQELAQAKATRKELTEERKALESYVTKRKSARTRRQNKITDADEKAKMMLETVHDDNRILEGLLVSLRQFVRDARMRDEVAGAGGGEDSQSSMT
jgi:hypothetical protein